VKLISLSCGNIAQVPKARGQYCPSAEGTRAIFPQLREISLTIDLDASHYLHNIRSADRQFKRECEISIALLHYLVKY